MRCSYTHGHVSGGDGSQVLTGESSARRRTVLERCIYDQLRDRRACLTLAEQCHLLILLKENIDNCDYANSYQYENLSRQVKTEAELYVRAAAALPFDEYYDLLSDWQPSLNETDLMAAYDAVVEFFSPELKLYSGVTPPRCSRPGCTDHTPTGIYCECAKFICFACLVQSRGGRLCITCDTRAPAGMRQTCITVQHDI